MASEFVLNANVVKRVVRAADGRALVDSEGRWYVRTPVKRQLIAGLPAAS